MYKSVKEYCRTCERLGKGSVNIRAPLLNLHVVAKPFSRLLVADVNDLA